MSFPEREYQAWMVRRAEEIKERAEREGIDQREAGLRINAERGGFWEQAEHALATGERTATATADTHDAPPLPV